MLLVGSRLESHPPTTWTESGRTPVLGESSSSRLSPRLQDAVRWSADQLRVVRGSELRAARLAWSGLLAVGECPVKAVFTLVIKGGVAL